MAYRAWVASPVAFQGNRGSRENREMALAAFGAVEWWRGLMMSMMELVVVHHFTKG